MSKGLRTFKDAERRQIAQRRATWYTKESEKRKAPRGLGYWGANDFLKKHG